MMGWHKEQRGERGSERRRVRLGLTASNFTDRVRKVLAMAREEAIRLCHDYVGTEHILLGLMREREGVATIVIQRAGISDEAVPDLVQLNVRKGKATIALGELPYTSRAKETLEFAVTAAQELGHPYVGTEHLLLGLLEEEKGIAAQVLNGLGLTRDLAESLLLEVLREGRGEARRAGSRILVDDTSDRSIYEQIIVQVQEGVATGVLRPGERLPAVRQLADELDVAPGTVARAYSELERLGVVVTGGARGTRIAEPTARFAETADKSETLTGLLRPVAVAAFHLGATAPDLRAALERAMTGIYEPPPPAT